MLLVVALVAGVVSLVPGAEVAEVTVAVVVLNLVALTMEQVGDLRIMELARQIH